MSMHPPGGGFGGNFGGQPRRPQGGNPWQRLDPRRRLMVTVGAILAVLSLIAALVGLWPEGSTIYHIRWIPFFAGLVLVAAGLIRRDEY